MTIQGWLFSFSPEPHSPALLKINIIQFIYVKVYVSKNALVAMLLKEVKKK
jgi:hypothetical protein